MRTGPGLSGRSGAATATATASASAPSSSAPGGGPHSAWHSPVPYLFGGLAAMLCLIALALLILACSYWKLSRYFGSGDDHARSHHGKPSDASSSGKSLAIHEERVFVIMAGDHAPSFLAIPIASRAAAYNDTGGDNKNLDEEKEEPESAVTSLTGEGIIDGQVQGDSSPRQTPNQEQ